MSYEKRRHSNDGDYNEAGLEYQEAVYETALDY